MNSISLERVSLAVGGATVLSDISLTIAAGEFVGVLGPNGAGKTTLMRALLGLNRAKSGMITVLGKPVRPGNAEIGYLPQAHGPAPAVALAGREFLAASIGGNRLGLPFVSAAARRNIDRALAAVNAEALARRPVRDMSGGERQRLLVAQALIDEPRLLLLDEPLIGLDPHQQQVVVALVRRLSRGLNLTVLFSAHELNQLLGAIDRVLYLGRGQAALGTVSQVITPAVLSRVYGAPIDVVRANGHIFVMSEGTDIERDHHHDHVHRGRDHARL